MPSGLWQGVGLGEAEEILVKRAGLFDVMNVERDVRKPDDVRTRRLIAASDDSAMHNTMANATSFIASFMARQA